jgi:hypothetical protein
MKRNAASKSGIFQAGIVSAFALCVSAALLAIFGIAAAPPNQSPEVSGQTATPVLQPTFGHPVISGIGGNGYEADLRLDPVDPNRIYTSAPGALSSNTSWIWRSLDGGKTFKWVAGATPFEGKVTTCAGGADTELAVDSAGHLYFNDLTIANFSTARSDDGGSTFTCSNSGVPDVVIDRQWYAVDGDPTNGGTLYLANNENGPGGVSCSGASTANNVLVMYRSPYLGAGATAGVEFGPVKKITPDLSCDSGLPGNNEISPVATTLGQPNGSGGFATLSTPVKHIYVIHDDAAHHQIRMGRCFPVAFGPDLPNVSDPSGLNCTDLLVADMGASIRVGATFPSMAIDKAGNLYAVWQQAPIDGSGQIIGDTTLQYSSSTDQGNTWAAPIQIDTSGSPVGTLHNNVFGWVAAGDNGRIDIAWYGTPGTAPVPSNGPDSCACDWSVWLVQSLNAHHPTPTFTAPILASEHFIHRGTIWTFLGGQNGDRHLGDFLQLRVGSLGEAQISYADSNNVVGSVAVHAMYVRQNGGTGLYAATSPLNIPGLTPFNSVTDPPGDGKYEAGGTISANMPNLDIIGSSVSKLTTAPCSLAAPCYRVVMQVNNLSLAPDLTNDPNPDLVWLTQWLIPSTTDSHGGKNFFVYAESTAGGPIQCFVGENHANRNGDWYVLTYPGNPSSLPAANCGAVTGPNGTITIDVPISLVSETNPTDNRLHEVTASTMTLQAPASSTYPPVGSYGGSLFNLIDVAPPYVVNPNPDPVQLSGAVSRKTHGGAGTFDINLPVDGSGIECRSGGANGDYTVVFTFANQLASVGGANVTSGTASVSSSSIQNGVDYVVNLTGVSNPQKLTVTLTSVTDTTGNSSPAVAGTMSVLIGDLNGNKVVSNTDVASVKTQVAAPVTASNFRNDVNVNGVISNTDVSTTKAQVGTTLGGP